MDSARGRTAAGYDPPILTDMSFLAELWSFLRVRKKFWLLPLVAITLLVGALLILAETTALAPFIYTLF